MSEKKLPDFNQIRSPAAHFHLRKYLQYQISRNICRVGAALTLADRWIDVHEANTGALRLRELS